MLSRLVDSYLELRRATGFQMGVQKYLLHHFASFAAQRQGTHVRARTAIEWAAQAPSEGQRANRLGTVRVFARYACAEDARHEVPPQRVFSSPRVHYTPFIFTPSQLHELLVRASKLAPSRSLRAWTYCTLFSLLAVTGLRISEALNLRLQDVTPDGLLIRGTKFRKSRLVPLHPTTLAGLERYLDRRGAVADDHVFVSHQGWGLPYSSVVGIFLRLVRGMGIHPGPGHRGPRIHSLRHSFTVRVLEACPAPRHFTEIEAHMLALSTYLGHSRLDSTYWYIHATPHLLAEISQASEDFVKGGKS
jgi:integrase/recombinase XerD